MTSIPPTDYTRVPTEQPSTSDNSTTLPGPGPSEGRTSTDFPYSSIDTSVRVIDNGNTFYLAEHATVHFSKYGAAFGLLQSAPGVCYHTGAAISASNRSFMLSKYIIQVKYQSRPEQPAGNVSLIVNTDLAMPKFSSKGTGNEAQAYALDLEYRSIEDLTGFAMFEGTIGEGQIYLTTDKGVKITGPIEGGPTDVQSFVGRGTWLMS